MAHDWNAALPAFREALAAYQRLAAQEPQNSGYAQQVVNCRRLLAYTERQRKDWKAALDDMRQVQLADQARVHAAPNDRNAQMDLAFDWNNIGVDFEGARELKGAVAAYERAAALTSQVALADPQDSDAAILAACYLADVAQAYGEIGDPSRSVPLFRQASEKFEAELRHDPANTQTRGLYAYFVVQWADLEARKKTPSGWRTATALYQRAEELFAPLKPVLDLDEEDMATKADLPRRLAECRSHLAEGGSSAGR
jgi:tetratricopeptide (TPR) repeat protein